MTDYFHRWWFATTQFQTVSRGHLIKKPASSEWSVLRVFLTLGIYPSCFGQSRENADMLIKCNSVLAQRMFFFCLRGRSSSRACFFLLRICSSLFGVHCKCVFDLKGINYSNHRLLVMSFPVSREQPATGNELQDYIRSTFLTFPTIFPLFDVWVCYPLLYVCICVKNREARITCFQMFHSDTWTLERVMKTRLFALHVRRDRHTYITDSLMYTNIRKRFTFIRVSL